MMDESADSTHASIYTLSHQFKIDGMSCSTLGYVIMIDVAPLKHTHKRTHTQALSDEELCEHSRTFADSFW